jgi:hypothetical protein
VNTGALEMPPAGLTTTRQASAVSSAVIAGLLIGIVYSFSPLTVWCLLAAAVVMWLAGRGLPAREGRWVRGMIVAGIAARVGMVAWLFLFGGSDHGSFNVFFGDEQYLIVRSLRMRDLWLGARLSPEALSDVFELYGWTSYLNVIAYVQLLVGPSPYGIHLLNTLFYVGGVVVLHRMVRDAFGRVPAVLTLFAVLFFPSLSIWSASGLKESLNFLVVMGVMAACVGAVRAPWGRRLLAVLGVIAGIAALSTFRAGAAEMIVAGLLLGLAGRWMTRRLWRLVVAVVAIAVLAVPALHNGRVQAETVRLLQSAARVQMGHVLTRGHSYKLIDQRFYDSGTTTAMGWDDAIRFVGRAAVSVVAFPAPWQAQSWSELAYLPEQLAWYLILLTAAFGVVAGLRRDALVTCLFLAYATAAMAIVALNTGNFGTLIRHRAFALPFLIALSAVGVVALAGRMLSTPSASPEMR